MRQGDYCMDLLVRYNLVILNTPGCVKFSNGQNKFIVNINMVNIRRRSKINK